MDKVVDVLQEIEEIADDILASRQQIVELDRKRNKNREALRALSKADPCDKKIWFCCGNMFVKTSIEKSKEMMNEDQTNLDNGIDTLRNEMKDKVSQLNRLEGKPELKGYNLKAMSSEEIAAMSDVLPKTM